MIVASEQQRSAWQTGRIAPAEEVRPGLWAVALPMPGDRMPYSLGYAMLDAGGVHLIDPGWGAAETIESWRAFLRSVDRGVHDIRTVLVTHSHPDHLGAAEGLRERSGAQIVMSTVEAEALNGRERLAHSLDRSEERFARWGVPEDFAAVLLARSREEMPSPPVRVDRVLEDGETVELGPWRATARVTPGHTGGHLSLVFNETGVIFTGDHVLPGIYPGLGLGSLRGSDPLTDYLTSLEAMSDYDHLEVLPGHEYRFNGLAERADRIAQHHLVRTRAIAELVPELGDAPVWEYAARSPWSRGWENLRGFMKVSALVQTELHLTAVRSGRVDKWLD